MLEHHEIEFRVRYEEADPMGFLHHANYLKYFEVGRIELNRANGGDYRQTEEEGLFFVVVKAECRYFKPARFDDLLRLRTTVAKVSEAKLEHEYELFRDGQRLCLGRVTLALVDRQGKVQNVRRWLASQPPPPEPEATKSPADR